MRVAVCDSKPLPEPMITFCQFVSKIRRNKIDYDWSQTPAVFSPQCVNKSGSYDVRYDMILSGHGSI